MELTKISEWFDGTSDYLPSVGSDVILMPLMVRDDLLYLRFVDHLGTGIDLELCSSDLHRIICFIKAQRALKGSNGARSTNPQTKNPLNFLNHYTNSLDRKNTIPRQREQPPADGKISALTEWFLDDGTYQPDREPTVCLTDILCKFDGDDRLSADSMNPENRDKEFYLLHFQAPSGNALEILLSRIDANRIIYFEESRQSLRLRETL